MDIRVVAGYLLTNIRVVAGYLLILLSALLMFGEAMSSDVTLLSFVGFFLLIPGIFLLRPSDRAPLNIRVVAGYLLTLLSVFLMFNQAGNLARAYTIYGRYFFEWVSRGPLFFVGFFLLIPGVFLLRPSDQAPLNIRVVAGYLLTLLSVLLMFGWVLDVEFLFFVGFFLLIPGIFLLWPSGRGEGLSGVVKNLREEGKVIEGSTLRTSEAHKRAPGLEGVVKDLRREQGATRFWLEISGAPSRHIPVEVSGEGTVVKEGDTVFVIGVPGTDGVLRTSEIRNISTGAVSREEPS